MEAEYKDGGKSEFPKRTRIAFFHTALPSGGAIEIDIYTQEDGGVGVAHVMRMDDGGVRDGGTCLYCEGGRKLGCCEAGEDADGNCTTGSFTCTPRRHGYTGPGSFAQILA